MNFEDNLPRNLVHINSLNPSTVSWESMRGKGLPDPSGNQWNLIISFFEKGHGERSDQTELVNFFVAIPIREIAVTSHTVYDVI